MESTTDIPVLILPKSRSRRIAWLAIKLLSLFSVLLSALVISPYLAAWKRDRFLSEIGVPTSQFQCTQSEYPGFRCRRIVFPNRISPTMRKTSGPAWAFYYLQRHFERYPFRIVDGLSFDANYVPASVFNRSLKSASALPTLETVRIENVFDETCDLSLLANQKQTQRLHFLNCTIDEPAIKALARMRSLISVMFLKCRLTPRAVDSLVELRQVNSLHVQGLDLERLQSLRTRMPRTYVSR